MSNQIQDLIANIQQKFDDEFKDSSIYKEDINPKKQNQREITQLHQNPESQRKSGDFEGRALNKQEKQNNSLVIEQDHQNEEGDQHFDNSQRFEQREQQNSHTHNVQQQEDEDNQNKYKDLSNKLQTALKKISSSKKQFGNSNDASTINSYLNRFQDYEKKKQKQLEAKRKIQEQKKIIGLKQKPDINSKSRQMAKQTSYKPIHQRYDRILEQKKKKLQSNLQNKKAQQQQQFEQFIQQFKKHSKIQPEQCRDIDTYFKDMMHWKQKLQKQMAEKKRQKQQQAKEGYTFKPQINKRSQKIIKNQKRVPIQDRQIQKAKVVQDQYSFQPKINKKRLQ